MGLGELNLNKAETVLWWGLIVPAGVPDDVVAKLERAFISAAASDKFRDTMAKQGANLRVLPGKATDVLIRDEYKALGEVAASLGIQRGKPSNGSRRYHPGGGGMATISVARWKAEIVGGALLAGVGGFFLFTGWKLPPPDEPGVPGPGSVPIALGLVIMLCGLWVMLDALRKGDGRAWSSAATSRASLSRAFVLATAFFEAAGFMLSTFLFSVRASCCSAMRDGGAPCRRGGGLCCLWLTFTKLLGVGLPYGLIAEILFR